MQELKKIGVLSVAKIFAMFGIFGGILFGLLYGLASMTTPMTLEQASELMVTNPQAGYAPILIAFGWWSLIIAPIFLGVVYYVSGLVVALLYNLFARLVGGIKVDLKDALIKKISKKK